MLQSMGWHRIGHNLATEQRQASEARICEQSLKDFSIALLTFLLLNCQPYFTESL